MAVLQEEKANTEAENEQLQHQLNTDTHEDPSSSTSIRHTQMQNQIGDLEEETYK